VIQAVLSTMASMIMADDGEEDISTGHRVRK
jgi:hypothetical protein